jgi:riboflavin kinase/FMN adenylyltransferase
MRVVDSWEGLDETLRNATVALGNFDGVHRGHAHLLRTAHAARPGAPLAVLTFEPHPREFFRPEDPPFRLTLAPERAAALAALGVQVLYELPFNESLSKLGAHAFIDHVLHHGVGAAHLACGADFAFGHRRGGDVTVLADRVQALGIGLTIVPKLSDAQGPISSTRIRRLLQDGYPERAAEELGRPWAIRGVVSHGDKRGRTIGFPTANVPLGRHLEPCRGCPGSPTLAAARPSTKARKAASRRTCSTGRAISTARKSASHCTASSAPNANSLPSRS